DVSAPRPTRRSAPTRLRLEKCLRISPLTQLPLELPRLVDEDLAVVGEHDARALERARRRTFEVDAGEAEAAAVARAFELVLGRQIVRRAPQMRAGTDDGVETAYVLNEVVRRADDPDAEFLLPSLVDAHAVLIWEAGLELLRRLIEHVGEHE